MPLWTLMDLWIYLDGLEHLLLYMWYILWWMWYGRIDVWMDEIYMRLMRYIWDGWDIYVIYVCMNLFVMMECKKIKNYRFGSLYRVLHSAKDPVAECHGHSTRQSWKMGARKTIFPALPSAMTMALGKDFFFKKSFCSSGGRAGALAHWGGGSGSVVDDTQRCVQG